MTPVAGAYPLTGVGKLANVTIASPGEVWSNLRANGNIVPGAAIAPVSVGGKLFAKQLLAGDTPDERQVGVALRQVQIPDVNTGPNALGPNELVNQLIADQDYLRRYLSGALHLTLVDPRADYTPGQKIGWNPAGARPAGKAAGTGSWTNVAGSILAGTDIFEVFEYRPYGSSNEGILTVRFLRSNQ
jgi:hypothetical protein